MERVRDEGASIRVAGLRGVKVKVESIVSSSAP